MIEMQEVTVHYSDFQLSASVTVADGEIIGIVGENGAGKTTLFKSLLGLIEIDAGKIVIHEMDQTIFLDQEKDNLGVVLSDAFFNPLFKVAELAKLLQGFYSNFERDYFDQLCKQLNLPLNQPIKEFSTGMLAKIKVITALTHQAQILVLDEPTSGLDVSARYVILDLLQDYLDRFPNTSVLISSHISDDLEHLCDKLYFLKKGQVVLSEETDALLGTYGLIKGNQVDLEKVPNKFQLSYRQTPYGFEVLTNQRNFVEENYPDLVVEKITIDQLLLMITEGEER